MRRLLILAILGSSLGGCSTLKKFFDSGPDDTAALEKTAQENAAPEASRAPASQLNPLRVSEYCVIDNFSRVQGCYQSLDLCKKAAQGFGMCSGR